MNEEKAHRIIDAFNTVREGIWPHWYTEQTERDVEWLRTRYNGLKPTMGFGEAMRQAQTEFIIMVYKHS